MKHPHSLILGAICFVMISLIGMSSCAKNSSEEQAQSTLEFWDTYEAATLLPVMEAIDEATAEEYDNPLRVMLSGMTEPQGPVVGCAFYNDTAKINAIFQSESAKSLLPEDIRFAWTGYAPPRSSIYPLIALKAHDGGPLLAENIVKDAMVEDSEWGLAVAVIPTEEGAAKLKELDEAYPEKIYLVIEGAVYPIVKQEGKYLIPGIFEDEVAAEEFAKKIKR